MEPSGKIVSTETTPISTLEQRIVHCKAGYENSQAVVRFLDAKASAVVGVIPIVIAALAGLVGLSRDWVDWRAAFDSPNACVLWVAIVVALLLAIALFVFAILAVVSAFGAISPRPPANAKPSVLFPFDMTYGHPPPDDSYAARLRFLRELGSHADFLEDYERQLLRMSQIVAEKMRHVQCAIERLTIFFGLAASLLGFLCCAVLIGAILSN